MRIPSLLLLICIGHEVTAGTFNGIIDIGGHVSVGTSLLMGGTARREEATSSIAKTDYHRIIHPDINYGFTFNLTSNPKKRAQAYLQADVFLQNHWLENKWGTYRANGDLVYMKSTYYRMFETGFSFGGGIMIKHFKIGIGLDHIFTISNYSKTNLFYKSVNYPYEFFDKRGGNEATWFYKTDMIFKIGYQIRIGKRFLIEPYAAYAVGVFHQYDAPINYWGLGESGRIDNCRVGVSISKVIAAK